MNYDHEIDVNLLPERLQKLVRLIGITATLALVRKWGGTRLWVPTTMTAEHPIAQLIGFEAASKLAGEYGGQEHTYLPMGERALRLVRDRCIAGARSARSARDLALEHRITERLVYYIWERVPADQALFEPDADDPQQRLI